MNLIDRAVAWANPAAGLRRQAARKILSRSGVPKTAKRFASRHDKAWGVNSGDPNDGRPRQFVSRKTILKLVAENPFARKAMNALLNSVVGWGIKGVPAGSRALKTLWAEWIKVCDFYGRLDLYGLQELWARCMFRDGEVFIVARFVKGVAGIPLRLQSFDKGLLATNTIADNVHRGIEYDADGRVVAYHFYRTRPNQRWWTGETVRFPAEEVIHLFHAEFIGQTEGVSIFESVVKRLGDVDEGIEAEVVKANISACMVGFRTRGTGDEMPMGIAADEDRPDRPPVEEFVPGMIETLEDGETITFSDPPRSGGIGELSRIALLASAAGIGATYEQVTGDLSNVNYSSYRAGRLEFNRTVGRIQFLTFIPVGLDRVWAWFLKAGIDFGQLPNRQVPIAWTPPPIESINRLDDAEADILEMEAGLESRENLLAGRGYDQDEIIAAIAAGRAKADAAKLTFKGDVVEQPTSGGGERAVDPALVRQIARLIERERARA